MKKMIACNTDSQESDDVDEAFGPFGIIIIIVNSNDA